MMSSNRVIVDTNGRQFFADSFQRFGDDLNELIISYLTLEDKTRLQCVAKQWKRLVFNGQTSLRVSEYNSKNEYNTIRRLLEDRSSDFTAQIDSNRLKSLLALCPNIKSIEIVDDIQVDDLSLDVITNHCSGLQSIHFSTYCVSTEAIARFGQKFGQTLKRIEFVIDFTYRSIRFVGESGIQRILLSMCPNIESLECDSFLLETPQIPAIRPMKNLKVFKLYGNPENWFFQGMTQLMPNLKYFKFYAFTTLPLNLLPDPLLHLEHFVTLHITNYSSFGADIASRMPNLKRLDLEIGSGPLDDQLLQGLSRLQSLTELYLNYYLDHSVTDSGVCRLIDNCKHLKTIHMNIKIEITEKTIEKLVAKASIDPKEEFEFVFCGTESYVPIINYLDNLTIKVYQY